MACLSFSMLSFTLAPVLSPNLRVTGWLQQLQDPHPLSFKSSGKNIVDLEGGAVLNLTESDLTG